MPKKVTRKASGYNPLANERKLKILSWSYSRLQTYRACPRKALLAYIEKVPDPGNKAMERGSRIHTLCENYVGKEGRAPKMPDELSAFAAEFKELRKVPAKHREIEVSWAFTPDWQPTAWFGDPFLRVKLDFATFNNRTNISRVIDYKTGKVRKQHEEQLELYACAALVMHEADEVDAELWYLDSGDLTSITYEREEIEEVLMPKWTAEPAAMLKDVKFLPRKSGMCGYCAYSPSNGGPCDIE